LCQDFILPFYVSIEFFVLLSVWYLLILICLHLQGGVQTNVVPTELTAVFDVRVTPSVDHEEFEATIKRWCEEAGSDVTYSFEQKNPKVENTKLDDSNPYWIAFKKKCDEIGVNLEIGIFPGGTDSRFVRGVSIILLFIKKI